MRRGAGHIGRPLVPRLPTGIWRLASGIRPLQFLVVGAQPLVVEEAQLLQRLLLALTHLLVADLELLGDLRPLALAVFCYWELVAAWAGGAAKTGGDASPARRAPDRDGNRVGNGGKQVNFAALSVAWADVGEAERCAGRGPSSRRSMLFSLCSSTTRRPEAERDSEPDACSGAVPAVRVCPVTRRSANLNDQRCDYLHPVGSGMPSQKSKLSTEIRLTGSIVARGAKLPPQPQTPRSTLPIVAAHSTNPQIAPW